MISDIASFLRYFDGIHRRTVRDVSTLPIEAEIWMPPEAEDEEGSWGVVSQREKEARKAGP